MRLFSTRFLHQSPAPGAPPATPPPDNSRRANDLVTRLVAEHGSVENALQRLALRSIQAEDALAVRDREVADYRARLPEGAVVLPKAEAENLAKLRALGTVDEVIAKVAKAGELERQVAQQTQEGLARQAAAHAGLDPEAFAAYATRVTLPIELRDVPAGRGKPGTVKVPYVRKPGDDRAAWVTAEEWVGGLPAYEQRALRLTSTSAAPAAPAASSRTYPAQAPAPVGAPSDPTAEFIRQRDARNAQRVNPLFPAPSSPAPGAA